MSKPAEFTRSYMEFCFHAEGGDNVYLRVPTVWDDINKQYIGFIKTPKTKKIISGQGKNDFELQNSFQKSMYEAMTSSEEMGEEVLSMFKPYSFYDKEGETK